MAVNSNLEGFSFNTDQASKTSGTIHIKPSDMEVLRAANRELLKAARTLLEDRTRLEWILARIDELDLLTMEIATPPFKPGIDRDRLDKAIEEARHHA